MAYQDNNRINIYNNAYNKNRVKYDLPMIEMLFETNDS